jgi:hypothetical protein
MDNLMLRCFTEIVFTQLTQVKGAAARNMAFRFNFVTGFEFDMTWTELTNTCKITLPKNVFVTDPDTGVKVNLQNNQNPQYYITNLFMRGDKVEIRFGYYIYDTSGQELLTAPKSPAVANFSGYITRVNSKQPITIECEDNMWLLKQIPCPPGVLDADQAIEDYLKPLLAPKNLTVNPLSTTSVGALQIQKESVAQLLLRLRNDFHLESYFSGNELRIGSLVYIPPPPNQNIYSFIFQQNIISDELSYQRKDDVKLSAICESINTVQIPGSFNKQNQQKTQQQRLEVLVYADEKGNFKFQQKQKDVDFPVNNEGERRTLFFPGITDPASLAKLGANKLRNYYYTGFKGHFTTFAYPLVKLGDYIQLVDPVLPDRTGYYVVKSVLYSGGINGHRQVIELDYKLVETPDNVIAPDDTPTQ